MATKGREKIAILVNSETLARLQAIARSEGRQLQTLIDEALADLIKKRRQSGPRAHVMAAYQVSIEEFNSLYTKLAE